MLLHIIASYYRQRDTCIWIIAYAISVSRPADILIRHRTSKPRSVTDENYQSTFLLAPPLKSIT